MNDHASMASWASRNFLLRSICSVAFVSAVAGIGLSDAYAVPALGICGDATADGRISTSDALFTLQVAVGTRTCLPQRCDCNASGTVTASDAMAILKAAVRLPITLRCPPPDTTTSTTTTTTSSSSTTTSSTSTTTTSLPETCGNGTVDPGEDCDPIESFCRGGCNPILGICVDFMCNADCTCPEPLCGDYLVDPDESCDPPGSECENGTCNASCHCEP